MANGSENQDGKQGKGLSPQALISFFVRNEAAHKAMKRRTVIDSNNEEHEAVTVSWNWRDTWQEEHKRAFVVAKMVKADLLADVHGSLQKALDEGVPFEQWRKQIVPKLEGKWLGKTVGQLWDELSDEEKAKREPPTEEQREKVIAPKRLELIFRTNMAVANAAGHYSQLMKTKDIYPYWRYVTRDDARVRTSHRALHNKVYKWDDPFWQTFFPPNGFRCRCHVSPMTKRQVERDPMLHIEQSTIAEDADGRKVLDVGGYYYKNNPGWDYNPGDSIDHLERLAKDNTKGRPAQVQADLEADLAKMEAKETAIAKQRKSESQGTQRLLQLLPPEISNGRLASGEIFKQINGTNESSNQHSKTVYKRSSTPGVDEKVRELYAALKQSRELPPVHCKSLQAVVDKDRNEISLLFGKPQYTSVENILSTIQKYSTEHCIAISADRHVMFEVASGRPGDVNMPQSYPLEGSEIFHNHPDDTLPSFEDLDEARNVKAARLIIACKNGKRYAIKPNANELLTTLKYKEACLNAGYYVDPTGNFINSKTFEREHSVELYDYLVNNYPWIEEV